jgi:hypothetical protein
MWVMGGSVRGVSVRQLCTCTLFFFFFLRITGAFERAREQMLSPHWHSNCTALTPLQRNARDIMQPGGCGAPLHDLVSQLPFYFQALAQFQAILPLPLEAARAEFTALIHTFTSSTPVAYIMLRYALPAIIVERVSWRRGRICLYVAISSACVSHRTHHTCAHAFCSLCLMQRKFVPLWVNGPRIDVLIGIVSYVRGASMYSWGFFLFFSFFCRLFISLNK